MSGPWQIVTPCHGSNFLRTDGLPLIACNTADSLSLDSQEIYVIFDPGLGYISSA